MRKRVRTISAIVFGALLVLPAAAHAADPLLSGYGGPGGGEQAVLGSELLPPSGGGGGSLQAAPAPATSGSHDGAATPRAPASAPSTGEGRADRGSTKDDRERRHATNEDAGATTAPAAGSPKVIPYPTRANSASGLPLSNGDVLLALLGVAALVLMGLGLRRLVPREPMPMA